jgi:hypothetical protein
MSNRTSRSAEAISVSEKREQGCGGCVLRSAAVIFLIAGMAMSYFLLFQPLWQIAQARGWDETPCTIRSSEVEVKRGDESNSYIIRIIYDYEYAGLPFEGDRYHFAISNTNTNVKWKRQVVKDHPPGRQTVCYVDPDDPAESVLERGWTREMFWGLFPLPFLAFGLGGLLFGHRLMKQQHAGASAEAGASTTAGATAPQAGARSIAGVGSGPVVLKPENSPAAAFGVALFVCLFWNGITGIFVAQVVGSFLDGDPEWFLTVFMTPFVLIGLFLVGATGYTFLTLFNPRPELTLSRGAAPLGGLLQVRWQFRGSVRRIRNFKLSLKGEEKATYRRGTDTQTDTQTFFEHVFYEADHPVHIATGEAEFEVPADSMHSFDAPNNKIVWTLDVHGDIPWWPDVSMSFPIEVTPHERTADPHA